MSTINFTRIVLNLECVPLPQEFQNHYYSKIMISKKIVCDALKIHAEMCVYTHMHMYTHTHTHTPVVVRNTYLLVYMRKNGSHLWH